MLLLLFTAGPPVPAAPAVPAGTGLEDEAAADDAPRPGQVRLLYRRQHTAREEAAGSESAWSVRELRFSADGRQLLTRAEPSRPDQPRELLLWDTATGRVLSRIHCGPGRLNSCDLSADATQLLAGAAPAEEAAGGEIRLIDVASGEVRQRLESSDGLARFLPGGGELLTVTRFLTGDVLRRYRTDTGQETARSILPLSYRLHIAPAGDLLLSASSQRDPRLKLIEASTGRQLAVLTGCTRTPAAMAISPDGSVCGASAGNGQVLVWERDTGLLLHRLEGHAGRTTALAFSHDSRQLASAGSDGTVHLWHVASG
ncbi:MAG: hypothetical protein KDA79_15400, partial [Planctomycetaceae bacterium]|nr:hypothetical protein [Planctomycetaceae bacterium]